MMWTRFMDMHSGGGCKEEPYDKIYIEAPEDEARVIFYNRFGHSPDRVSCTCCGEDYSIDEDKTFEKASEYDRVHSYSVKEPISVEDFMKRPNILVIPASEIEDYEREGEVPRQGYCWID